MKERTSLEDILGTPEEYQAAQKKEADKWAATCARYRGKLLQESHAKFESQLPPEKRNPKGMYDPDTAMQWNGWQTCMDFTPRLRFAKMEIVLPADENERATAIDEFNGMLRAYIGNMCRTWGHGSVVRKGLCDDAERAAAHARVILTEIEYSNFRIGIVDHGGRSEHRYYKAEK